jgi:hypothetical protein
MAFAKLRAATKNRIHSTLAKHALSLKAVIDLFAPKWKGEFLELVQRLPEGTQRRVRQELEVLDAFSSKSTGLKSGSASGPSALQVCGCCGAC